MNNPTKNLTTLYRYFDSDGHLLYVGITGDNTKRQSQHRRNAFWFGEIASATFEHLPTRQEALEAEAKAIKNENPKHNISRGSTLRHSSFTHMVFLAGQPDGGHDKDHEDFVSLYQGFFMMANGNFNTRQDVVAFAMKLTKNMSSVKRKKRNLKNLDSCSLCIEAYEADWFLNTEVMAEKL